MKTLYSSTGHLISYLSDLAKDESQKSGITSDEARNLIAKRIGMKSWSDTLSTSIYVEPDVHKTMILQRDVESDSIFYDVEGVARLTSAVIDQPYHDILPPMVIKREVTIGKPPKLGPPKIHFWVTYIQPDHNHKDSHNGEIFKPEPAALCEDLGAAFVDLDTGDPSTLIRQMSKSGFLSVDHLKPIQAGDQEALLEIQMREQGASIGIRQPLTPVDEPDLGDDLFHPKRCFVNEVTSREGEPRPQVVISNSTHLADELMWRVFQRDAFEDLKEVMKQDLGVASDDVLAAETWMHDLLLTPRKLH